MANKDKTHLQMAMNIKDRSFDMIDIASSDDDLKIKLLMSNNAYLCEIMTLLALQTDYMESLIINIFHKGGEENKST